MTESDEFERASDMNTSLYHYVREGMKRLPGTTDKVPHHSVNIVLVIAYTRALAAAP